MKAAIRTHLPAAAGKTIPGNLHSAKQNHVGEGDDGLRKCVRAWYGWRVLAFMCYRKKKCYGKSGKSVIVHTYLAVKQSNFRASALAVWAHPFVIANHFRHFQKGQQFRDGEGAVRRGEVQVENPHAVAA
jgi:hypothetical protein